MSSHRVQVGQSVFDVALIVYGANEGAAWLVEDNNLSGWSVSPGDELIVRDEVINQAVVDYFQGVNSTRKAITPATDEPDNSPPDFNNDFNEDFG